ncbi:MAG: hypothetical protein ACE5JE_05465 [Thermoplasmata archaeon]
MREKAATGQRWRRPWLWIGVLIAVGLVTGTTAAFLLAPSAPQRTFTVMAYHWGFAIYDESGTEVPAIEVASGTQVTLEIFSGASLDHEAHHEMMERTVVAWADNPEYGAKTAIELMELMEDAEAAGLNDHVLTIPQFGVSMWTDHESPEPARVTFVADEAGTFDITCAGLCGWGHIYMHLEGGLVVS